MIIHNNFSEIKKDDYDVLMVNSDQSWRRFDNNFYDYGFLKFAKDWKIKKFVYGASIGYDNWRLSNLEDKTIKNLLKDFSGISIREKGSIKLIKKHLGIKPLLVLDPTLLIDKEYYLDIIRDYKGEVTFQKKYIFIYCIDISKRFVKTIKKATKILNYESYYLTLKNCTVQNFLYYLVNSDAVITNSYHGTLFSIIFNKSFITLYNKILPLERFHSLGNLLGINDRFYEYGKKINIYQLLKPLKINFEILNKLKLQSINFIKNNIEK